MIACLDQRRRLSHGGGELDLEPAADQGIELHPADTDPSASSDFGGLVRRLPAAVVRPSSLADVASVILLAARSDRLTVAPRGNGHSLHGQAMADGGVVLNMRALAAVGRMELVAAGDVAAAAADVPGGALWEDVLTWAVHSHGLAPASWTDYLGLTVGGTLSNGGISGQSFRHGPQISNVIELEVVTGDGERHVCSAVARADLFFAVLGGLGQFGVITRARIPLHPAPEMVRWMRVVYSRFEEYSADAERLVGRTGHAGFDYVEGFAFVNSEDPVNGWGSVSLRPGAFFDSARIPAGSGPVLYCLEVALNFRRGEETLVRKRAGEMMRHLRYVPGLEFTADVGYVEFLSRVKVVEEEARANGSWAAPHPWLNLFISSADIADFDRKVFKHILRDGIGGPMLVYPLLRNKWDQRTSVALPESELFYLVALLRFGRPYPDGPSAEEMLAQNREIVRVCDVNRYDYKLYLPHYDSEMEWAGHFGRGWERFVERKSRYDPLSILAPGQKIFSRARPAAGSSR